MWLLLVCCCCVYEGWWSCCWCGFCIFLTRATQTKHTTKKTQKQKQLTTSEYIAVEKIESALGKAPLVDQIWVYGNSFEAVLVAVVVPS